MAKEIWKDIPGYEGLYKISSYGNIMNKKNNNLKYMNRRGYLYVSLWKNNKGKKYRVHRLVAEIFIPKIQGKDVVNHIDENKRNNKVDNLEWCTQQENLKKYFENHKTIKKSKKRITEYHKPQPVAQIDKKGNLIKIWDSMMQIERALNIKSGNISNCCNGKAKTVKGYYWKRYNGGEI